MDRWDLGPPGAGQEATYPVVLLGWQGPHVLGAGERELETLEPGPGEREGRGGSRG